IRVPEGATPEQRGHALLAQHCETCHATLPPEKAADRIGAIVRSGRGPMPAFSETTIPTADVTAIAAYLANPTAGALPGSGRGGPQGPPPPEGQTRYYTPYGTLNASN